jgi:hypothetical protein
MNRRERRAQQAKAGGGKAPQYQLEILPGSTGDEDEAVTGHVALIERYSERLAASMSAAMKKGWALEDCVALIVSTDDGKPDIAEVVSRAVAVEMGALASPILGDALSKSPGPGLLHLYVFANDASGLHILEAILLSPGGQS